MQQSDTVQSPRQESSISRQIILLLLTFAILPLAALTGLVYVTDVSIHRDEIAQVQSEVADRVAQVVLLHVQSSLNSLKLLTLSSDLVEQDLPEVRRALSSFLFHQNEFDAVALTRLDGMPIARLSRLRTYHENEQEWLGEEPAFSRALNGETGLGKVQMPSCSRFPQLRLYVPVMGRSDRVVGIICADMNISQMWRLVARSFTGSKISAYIVDRDGILIAADDVSAVLERRDLKDLESVKRFLAGGYGVFEYAGMGGEPVVGMVVETPLTGWGVVVETSVDTVFRHVKLLWWILGAASLAMILCAGLFGWLFSVRNILRPIRALQRDVQIIATGDLSHQISIERTDELGKLAADLSTMTESLRYLTVSREMLTHENQKRKKTETALRENERRQADILNFLPDATLAIDNEKRVIIWNRAIQEMTGIPSEEMIGQGDHAYTVPFYGVRRSQLMDLIWENSEEIAARYPFIKQEGHSFVAEVFCPMLYGGKGAWIFAKASPLHDQDGKVIGAIESVRDITDRKQTEEALERRLIALTRPLDVGGGIEFEELFNLDEIQRLQDRFALATGVASIITRTDGTPITKASNFCLLCDSIIRKTPKGLANCYRSDAVIGRHNPEGPIVQTCLSGGLWDAGASITVGGRHIANWLIGQVRNEAQDEARMLEYAREIGADEVEFMKAFHDVTAMPKEQFERIAHALFTLAGQLSSMAYQNTQQARFITEHRRAQEEKEKLQAQLLQAQKMEAVGRLAGGIAHDFNNMLQAIMGQTELALMHPGLDGSIQRRLQQVRDGAQRSAELVKQLLAFARKQTVSLMVLDLNETVEGMLKTLRRLIDENIDLAWLPGRNLWHVELDPSQIDQILANLAVNARDAIDGTGKITIETSNVALDESYCAQHSGVAPGEYVLLAVSDDGKGMDAKTMTQIFEPFFTTKSLGKGTGLGLATVYGIVKQNNGYINVYSEPERGTTFRVYLPRASSDEPHPVLKSTPPPAQTSTETLLMVEDEETVLSIGKTMLEGLGYTVLAAASPEEAFRLVREASGPIDLLVTDVVLPGMDGRDMARQIRSIQPGIKCLFMSGYTANVIAQEGALDEDASFISKPFSVDELAAKIRHVLDSTS